MSAGLFCAAFLILLTAGTVTPQEPVLPNAFVAVSSEVGVWGDDNSSEDPSDPRPPQILTALICDNTKQKISCENGAPLTIRSAFYGRTDPNVCGHNDRDDCRADWQDYVSRKCMDKHQCSLRATTKKFGDPCSDTPKYLNVTYSCERVPGQDPEPPRPPEPPSPDAAALARAAEEEAKKSMPPVCHRHVKTICDGASEDIDCGDKPVVIRGGMYGRMARGVCGDGNNTECRLNWRDPLLDLCQGKNKCTIKPSTDFGDPCPDTSKYLMVAYSCGCGPKRKRYGGTKVICDGTKGSIDCHGSPIIVHKATYGRSSAKNECGEVKQNFTKCRMDWKQAVMAQCGGETKCTLLPNTDYGDPCPAGTPKYLRVKYTCAVASQVGHTAFAAPGLKHKVICDGHSGKISCPSSNVVIRRATYGRTVVKNHCGEHNTTDCRQDWQHYVEEICRGRHNCTLHASNEHGDPCANVPKYLKISYSCAPIPPPPPPPPPVIIPPPPFQRKVICAKKIGHIDCGNLPIWVKKAEYGRSVASNECGESPHTDCKTNWLSHIRDICQDKTKCEINTNRTHEDPCHGVAPYLKVKFTCGAPPPPPGVTLPGGGYFSNGRYFYANGKPMPTPDKAAEWQAQLAAQVASSKGQQIGPNGEILPVGYKTSPSGHIITPSGQSLPLGYSVSSTGQIVTPSGTTLPTGFTVSPSGQVVTPTGTKLPTGFSVSSTGQVLTPSGQTLPKGYTVSPTGQVVTPGGQSLPKGYSVSESGQILNPSGNPMPAGSTVSASGQIIGPNGQVLASSPAQVLPVGYKNGPNGEIISPSGQVLPAGAVVNAQGQITLPNGQIIAPNGQVQKPTPPTTAPARPVPSPVPPEPKPEIFSKVVCEGQSVWISCNGMPFTFTEAVYGRTERGVCGDHPNTNCRLDWKNHLNEMCRNRRDCNVRASNEIGDPCGGVGKYLRFSYYCGAEHQHHQVAPPSPPPIKYTRIICEGRSDTISCGGGRPVTIHEAEYGRTDAHVCGYNPRTNCRMSWTNRVQSMCNNQQQCFLHADNGLGDPCGWVPKYLRVVYSCGAPPNVAPIVHVAPAPVAPPKTFTKIICEGSEEEIRCSDNRPIHIKNAIYGRTERQVCAWHSQTNCRLGWEWYVHGMCHNRPVCRVRADNRLGDPCWGVPKYLHITYECGGEPPSPSFGAQIYTKIICEGRRDAINCGNDRAITVHSAVYGRNNAWVCNWHWRTGCNLDWHHQVQDNCRNRQQCFLAADNRYGDPCWGVPKYLTVQYSCGPPGSASPF